MAKCRQTMKLDIEKYPNLNKIFSILQTISCPFFINPYWLKTGSFLFYFNQDVFIQVQTKGSLTVIRYSAQPYLIQHGIKVNDLQIVGKEIGMLFESLNENEIHFLSNFYLCRDVLGNIYASEVEFDDYHIIAGFQGENKEDNPWVLVKEKL